MIHFKWQTESVQMSLIRLLLPLVGSCTLSAQRWWLSPMIFTGGVTELLHSSHERGLLFSLFLFFMAQSIVRALLKIPPSVPLEEQRGGGGHTDSQPIGASVLLQPGVNRPINCKRFKPNRYSVNAISLRWDEVHINKHRNCWMHYKTSPKATVNYCLHGAYSRCDSL